MNEFEVYSSLLVLLVIPIICLLSIRLFSAGKTKKLPPSPPKLPIIGNLHQVGRLPHRSLSSLSKKYGPLMCLQLGNKPVVVISSAAVAKEVVKNYDVPFSGKPALNSAKRLFYGGKGLLFAPYGDQWRKLKTIFVNHLLHKRMIKSFKSVRDEETLNLVKNIDKFCSSSVPVNLTLMFSSMANHVICKAAFGKTFWKEGEGKSIMVIIEEAVQFLFTFTLGEFIPWLAWTNRLIGLEATLEKLAKSKDALLDGWIQQYLETSSTRDLNRDGYGENFADILVGMYMGNTPASSIDRDALKAITQDVIGAGTETIATTLDWAMTELIRHPKIMKKLQDEVRGVMNGRQNITDNELEKMLYLKAVVKETLRLHSPVAIGLRETNCNVELMGYSIPSDTMVMFNLWAICRDPAYWDEPEEFSPDRFLNSSLDYNGLDFQFIPFGAGRRICPGISFATASVEHSLANVMLKFDWQLPNGRKGEDLDVFEKPGIIVGRKNPLIVVPTK